MDEATDAEDMQQVLTAQLLEQRTALQDVAEALAADPSDELREMHEELIASITEMEEALRDVNAAPADGLATSSTLAEEPEIPALVIGSYCRSVLCTEAALWAPLPRWCPPHDCDHTESLL